MSEVDPLLNLSIFAKARKQCEEDFRVLEERCRIQGWTIEIVEPDHANFFVRIDASRLRFSFLPMERLWSVNITRPKGNTNLPIYAQMDGTLAMIEAAAQGDFFK